MRRATEEKRVGKWGWGGGRWRLLRGRWTVQERGGQKGLVEKIRAEGGPEEAGEGRGRGGGRGGLERGCLPGTADNRAKKSQGGKGCSVPKEPQGGCSVSGTENGTAEGMRPDRGRCAQYT